MTATATTPARLSVKGRKAVAGAWAGLWVDMFDVYLPVIVLAPAAVFFQPTNVSDTTSQIITALVFSATLLGRPIGAVIFGHISDRTGRRRASVIALRGFGLVTLTIACLPGYGAVGLVSTFALIFLRFADGIFLGGQYTAATPLALEQSPHTRRGLVGAVIMTGFPLAYCTIALITMVLLKAMPADGIGSAYVQWGWRIPFVIGGLLALGLVPWISRNLEESDAWKQAPKTSEAPLRSLFRGPNLRGFLQVFILMSGLWLAFNVIGAVLPGALKRSAGLTDQQVTWLMVVAYALLAASYLVVGTLSQRIGRRPFFLIAGALTATAAPVLYGILVSKAVTGFALIAVVTIALVLIVVSTFGVVTTYIIERFHVGVRSSGYGLGYTAAVIVPAFYVFYQTALSALMPMKYTPLVLLAIGGVLIVAGAALGPETRDADLSGAVAETRDADLLTGSIPGVPYTHPSGHPQYNNQHLQE
ncbi:MFS transporter [Streptomyces sp. NPDC050625]|uniref:MFS transporter n=1 Tax=Streptomyces sp. NPDC050625 TaxID=3154629 RepID=UPI003441302F